MNLSMRPIETSYKGYRFRSRIEARWAVFFDGIGLRWDYEPQGFHLRGHMYLPDFYIKDMDCYIEIKGANPSDDEIQKCQALHEESGLEVFLFWGSIDDNYRNACGDSRGHESCLSFWGEYYDTNHIWFHCPTCNAIGIEHSAGGAERIRHKEGCKDKEDNFNNVPSTYIAGELFDGPDGVKVWRSVVKNNPIYSKRLDMAFKSAIGMRF